MRSIYLYSDESNSLIAAVKAIAWSSFFTRISSIGTNRRCATSYPISQIRYDFKLAVVVTWIFLYRFAESAVERIFCTLVSVHFGLLFLAFCPKLAHVRHQVNYYDVLRPPKRLQLFHISSDEVGMVIRHAHVVNVGDLVGHANGINGNQLSSV
jgi:hypothetical protein